MKSNGCVTKFNADGRYTAGKSGGPRSAASKAFSQLCRVKNIKGQCTFYVTVAETSRGSSDKEFTYKLKREKLSAPLTIGEGDSARVIEYQTTAKSMSPEQAKKECGKSRGPMKKRTAKKMKH
jgi:hypothetical protein